MPSTKKRINLTVPDNVYMQLQKYKEDNGLESDATACLQLIVQQLRSQENGKAFWKFLRESSLEQLRQTSDEGFIALKEYLDNDLIK